MTLTRLRVVVSGRSENSMELPESKTAVVTGAAQGIGRAIVRALLLRGDRVVAVDANETGLNDLTTIDGSRDGALEPVVADVSREDSWDRIVAATRARFGPAMILVNNAGISPKHGGRRIPGGETPLEEWERVLAVNLTGPFLGICAVLPDMREVGWGRIVNMSSTAGRQGARQAGVHYGASKAGILGLTRSFAYELGQYAITVNSVAPGRIMTPMAHEVPERVNQQKLAEQPVRRFGQPEDIADTVAFLTSEAASFITGATVDANGGSYMG
jgi:3-oxoacyl-[acyl-carrier protein] reductase